MLYGTTENFLRCFNVSSLDELPALPEEEEAQSSEADEEDQAEDLAQNNEEITEAPKTELSDE